MATRGKNARLKAELRERIDNIDGRLAAMSFDGMDDEAYEAANAELRDIAAEIAVMRPLVEEATA